MRRDGDVRRAVDEVGKEGRLDIMVNNVGGAAGGGYAGERLHETSEEEWEGVVGVNLRTAFLGTKGAVGRMLGQERRKVGEGKGKGERGCVINLGSVAGLVGVRGFGEFSFFFSLFGKGGGGGGVADEMSRVNYRVSTAS